MDSESSELARLKRIFPKPDWAAEQLHKLAQFAVASSGVCGMFVFGSVARGTATDLSDVDVCLLLEHADRAGSVRQTLIELFKPQTVLALPMPRKVRFFLFDSKRLLCKLGVGLVDDLQQKAEDFITSWLGSADVPRMVLCDKRGTLQTRLSRMLGPDKARLLPNDYSPSWQAQQFLLKFDACVSCLHDAYQSALWLTLLRHHLLVLEMISLGETKFLYRPHRAFERFPSLFTRQLPASPPAQLKQRQVLLFAHAVAFADVCAAFSDKQLAQQHLPVLDALCRSSLDCDNFLSIATVAGSRRAVLRRAFHAPTLTALWLRFKLHALCAILAIAMFACFAFVKR